MTARRLIQVVSLRIGEREYVRLKKTAVAEYFLPDTSYGDRYYLLREPPSDAEMAKMHYNVVYVLRDRERVDAILSGIDWSEYLRRTTGVQTHLLPPDIYRAVEDALLRQECEQWR